MSNQNIRLRRQLTQSHDKNREELTMRNKFLTDRIQELETRMQTQFRASQVGIFLAYFNFETVYHKFNL